MSMIIRKLGNCSRDIFPALSVLLLTILFSVLFEDSMRTLDCQAVLRAPLRFLRFTFLLCISLFILPTLYGFITQNKSAVLLQVKLAMGLEVEPLRHWIFRPFQGIGIGLLFSTKLLGVLQLVGGPGVETSLLIPEGHFQAGRFLMITLITVLVSILLSLLWTLDDLGVRYFNRKEQELKMIGKYVGTVMPVIFGFYGLINLLGSYPTAEAVLFVIKIAVVLYPPLALFAVLHTYFIKSRIGVASTSFLRQGNIQVDR